MTTVMAICPSYDMLEISLHFKQVIKFFIMPMNFLSMIYGCFPNHWSMISAIFLCKYGLESLICAQPWVALVFDLVKDIGEVFGAVCQVGIYRQLGLWVLVGWSRWSFACSSSSGRTSVGIHSVCLLPLMSPPAGDLCSPCRRNGLLAFTMPTRRSVLPGGDLLGYISARLKAAKKITQAAAF